MKKQTLRRAGGVHRACARLRCLLIVPVLLLSCFGLKANAQTAEPRVTVEVRFMDDSLRGERFSGDFHLEDGIYHIMSVLQLTYKFHYKVNRDNIELYAN